MLTSECVDVSMDCSGRGVDAGGEDGASWCASATSDGGVKMGPMAYRIIKMSEPTINRATARRMQAIAANIPVETLKNKEAKPRIIMDIPMIREGSRFLLVNVGFIIHLF